MNTNLQETYWERVVCDFRRLCVLRRQRRREESEALMRHELPRSIAEWSRQQPGDATAKKAQLDAMFNTEQRRVEDVWMMQDILSSKLVEDFVPVICSRVNEEVRKAISVIELMAQDQQAARSMTAKPAPALKVAFDDIPSILDLLLAEPPEISPHRTQQAA